LESFTFEVALMPQPFALPLRSLVGVAFRSSH